MAKNLAFCISFQELFMYLLIESKKLGQLYLGWMPEAAIKLSKMSMLKPFFCWKDYKYCCFISESVRISE